MQGTSVSDEVTLISSRPATLGLGWEDPLPMSIGELGNGQRPPGNGRTLLPRRHVNPVHVGFFVHQDVDEYMVAQQHAEMVHAVVNAQADQIAGLPWLVSGQAAEFRARI